MVKYAVEAEFDYHSLNYGKNMHAAHAEVAKYRSVVIAVTVAIIVADVERVGVVIDRINVVIAGGRSLITVE